MVSAYSLNTSVSNIGNLAGPSAGGILITNYDVASIFRILLRFTCAADLDSLACREKILTQRPQKAGFVLHSLKWVKGSATRTPFPELNGCCSPW